MVGLADPSFVALDRNGGVLNNVSELSSVWGHEPLVHLESF